MPPKPRITREMILDAAYSITREQGIDMVNARTIAKRLDCSTQPVLYCFRHVEDIRREVYRMADAYHSEFLMQLPDGLDPMMAMGLNYIRFAEREKHLFRLLFQSDHFSGQNITALTEMPELKPVLEIFQNEAALSLEQVKIVFRSLLMLVHGWASMLANNSMEYREEEVIPILEMTFMGMLGAIKQEEAQQ